MNIMKALRFREPSYHGETYWRIPGSFSSKMVRERLQLLRQTTQDAIEDARGVPRVTVIAKAVGEGRNGARRGAEDEEEEEAEFGADASSSSSAASSSAAELASSFGGKTGPSMQLAASGVSLVNLHSSAGMIVCANRGGRMSADRFKAGAWELLGFHPVGRNSGRYHVKTAHDTFVTASSVSGRLSAAERATPDKNGLFEAMHLGGARKLLALRCVGTGKFWTADEDGVLTCDAARAEGEARFFVVSAGAGADGGSSSASSSGAAALSSSAAAAGSTSKRKRLVAADSEDDSDSDDSDDDFAQQFLAKTLAGAGGASDDDDDDDDDDDGAILGGAAGAPAAAGPAAAAPKRSRFLLSDSEEDDE